MPADAVQAAAAFTIAPADAGAVAWLRSALEAERLCALSEKTQVLCARNRDGAPLGAAGLEFYGRDGLLRSLVVAAPARGSGVGAALVAAVEREAQRAGIATLYLLTETAAPFFGALGYRPVARAEVPAALAASEQFRLHCPATAVCLCKRLQAP